MKHLTREIKVQIITRLAAFRTPTQIQTELRREFAVEVGTNLICRYLPTCKAGAQLSHEFKKLFETTRQQYVASIRLPGNPHRDVLLRQIAEEARDRNMAAVVVTSSANPPSATGKRTCLFLHVPLRASDPPYEVLEGGHEILASLRSEQTAKDV